MTLADCSIGQLNPTGNGTWFGTAGTYTVIAETTNNPSDLSNDPSITPNSDSATDAVTFTIEAVYPNPTVSITSPIDGTSYQRIAGDLATMIDYTIAGGIIFGNIETVALTITSGSGDTVSYTSNVTGEGSAAIAVDGIISALGSDSYTIAVTVTSDQGLTASDSVAVVVNEITATPPTVGVNLPNGSSYTFETGSAGSTVPVTFTAATDFGVIDTLTGSLDTTPVTDISITLDGISTPLTTGHQRIADLGPRFLHHHGHSHHGIWPSRSLHVLHG